ncbi:hypothetical protein PENTCL1PPCAC_12463, partial [Pristionchus entomophagus]
NGNMYSMCDNLIEEESEKNETSLNESRLGSEKKVEKFPCGLCSFVAHSQDDLGCHMTRHSGYRPHKCTIAECTESFANASILKTHLRVFHKMKPFRCSICGEMFYKYKKLVRHKRIHEEDLIEEEREKDETSLKESEKRVENFPCGVCSYVSVSHDGLRHHMTRHYGELLSKCTIGECTEAFPSSSVLKSHLRVF